MKAGQPESCWYVSGRLIVRVNSLQLLGIGDHCLLADSLRLFRLQIHMHDVMIIVHVGSMHMLAAPELPSHLSCCSHPCSQTSKQKTCNMRHALRAHCALPASQHPAHHLNTLPHALEWLQSWPHLTHCSALHEQAVQQQVQTQGSAVHNAVLSSVSESMYYTQTWDWHSHDQTQHYSTTQVHCLINHLQSHCMMSDLRFCFIGNGGVQHGSQHCGTVWSILLLNHVDACCMSADTYPFILQATKVETVT